MLFSLAGAFISPKFFRKIVYVDTLSELAHSVPLTQIDVPPAVYQQNLKHERHIKLPVPTHASLFGVPLEELMGYDGEKGGVPRVVRDCIQYLRETGLTDEGLFRRSPSSALLRQVQEAYDRGHNMSLDTFGDPHLAAVLLKKYLRDLPEPIFTETVYPIIMRCPVPTDDPTDWTSLMYIRDTLLPELPRCNYILLSHVLHLMHEVALRSATNLMDAHNLAVVLCPNLVKSPSPTRDVTMCAIPGGPTLYASQPSASAPQEGRTTLGMVIKLCIERYYEVFDEIYDRSEALPPARSFGDETMPSTPSSGSSSPRLPGQRRQSIHSNPRDSRGFDDDEDIDDAMLVMPIGPAGASSGQASPPSAWGVGNGGTNGYRPRHRTGLSNGDNAHQSSGVRSMHTVMSNRNGFTSAGRAKSTISIEKVHGGTVRKGSIAVGRGTTRKAAGAGVEAVGITAAGFFAPPNSVPPVPSVPGSGASQGESM